MAERIRLTSLEMLKPETENRSFQANFRLGLFLRHYFGPVGVRTYRELRKGGKLSKTEADEINQYVFNSIRADLGLPDDCDVRDFYVRQQKQGLDPVKYYGELLPALQFKLDLKDEVTSFSDRPCDFLELLATPPEKIDRTLAFELHRQAIFVYNAARNNAMHLLSRSQTVLSDLQHYLRTNLYEGPIGDGRTIFTESIHDDTNNEVVGFPYKDPRIPRTAHVKKVPFTARLIRGFGPVYTSPRKKDDAVVLIKAVASAPEERGEINTDCIKDRIGMEWVPLEADASPKKLMEKIVELINLGPYEVASVIVDDKVNQNRGQSPKTQFIRRIIKFKGVPVSCELRVLDLENFLNSRLEVGVRDQETGLYNGRAEPLYRLRRALQAALGIFPLEIYNDIDLSRAFIDQSKLEAQELRDMYMHKAA